MKKPLLLGIILTACVVIVAFVFAQFYPEGMISYWKFDEDPGPTAFDSADANNGTIYGATRTTGQVGGALSFDGLDDYVEVPNSANLDITDAITLEAWINPQTVGAWKRVIVKGEDIVSTDLNTWAYILGLSQGGGVYFALFAGNSQTYVNGAVTLIPINTWTHIAGTWDGAMMRIYVNGIEQSENLSFSGPINIVTCPLKFGIAPHGGVPYAFNGIIDEAAIHNRALSAEEIQHHYQDGLHGMGYDVECVTPPSGMVSWWPGDGDANDIVDGNNGTEYGATYAAGRVGQAFSFDGVDDYVSLGTTQIIGDDTSFTIDAWIKVNSFAADNKQIPIYGEYSSKTSDAKNYLAVGNTQLGLEQRVFFDQFIPSGWYLKSTIKLTPGRWYHVAYTQDGTTRCLYIDGTLDNSDSAIETYTGQVPNDIRIGRRGGTASNMRFDGLIDELEIFNRALSADEIQAIYSAGSAGKCKEAVVIEVDIDIKPGSYPNSINLVAHGLLPVAILGSPKFDVTTIDPGTIAIGEVTLAERGSKKAPKLAWSYEDVDGDGNTDMMTFFDVWKLVDEGVLTEGTTELSITATLGDGTPIEGKDSVNIVPY